MPSFGLEQRASGILNALRGGSSDVDSSTPETPEEFAQHVISTICHASVTSSVGRRTYERCMHALELGTSVRVCFRHAGKAEAIDMIWTERERLFREYTASSSKLSFLGSLPYVGPVTKHSLARRLGLFAEQHRAVA
jgi:hypothetical protein